MDSPVLVACTLAVLASPAVVSAQYELVGAVDAVQPDARGAAVQCDPGVTLRLQFLAPDLVRVTLERPDIREPLLDYPIVDQDWPDVDVQVQQTGDVIRLASDEMRVEVARESCAVRMSDTAGTTLFRNDPEMAIGWDGNEVRTWNVIHDDDRFYGLGEKTGALNKRGEEWVMWNSDTYAYVADRDPIYQSVPFFVGVRGSVAYGLYFNNSARSTFNFGAGQHRYWSFAAEQGPLDYFVMLGPDVPDVVDRYTELTGRPLMPPLWSLGYQQSRWSYYPDDEVLRIARTFREKRIPADVLYLDIHYMDEYRVFSWHPERFPQPVALLDSLEAMGFKVVTIIDPGVKVDTTSGYRVARELLDGRHYVRYPDGSPMIGSVWPGPSYFPDYSRPETQRWWGEWLGRLRAEGIDGIWNDMNEPAVWGKAFPLEALMYDNGRESSQKRMHNLYGYLMAQTAYDALRRVRPDERPFNLTRAGFAGEQRFTAVWTGDNVASWEHLRLGVRILLGLGLSGVPFIGTDVGGFVGSPSPELFARWVQVGVFSPLFRAHTTANTLDQEPWSFGEYVEDVARSAIELRYRLLPYMYSLFHEAHRTGAPIMRPMFWHFQEDSASFAVENSEQFMLGESLLVAPVVEEGGRFRSLWLPRGRWADLATGTVYEGGRRITVDAPLERIPMFLREGGILPLGPVAQHTGVLERGPLTLEVLPASDSAGSERGLRLFEDDGISYDFEDGDYRLTRFVTERQPDGSVRVIRTVDHDGHDIGERMLVINVHGIGTSPRSVQLNGRELEANAGATRDGWSWDVARMVVTVRLAEAGARQEIVIR